MTNEQSNPPEMPEEAHVLEYESLPPKATRWPSGCLLVGVAFGLSAMSVLIFLFPPFGSSKVYKYTVAVLWILADISALIGVLIGIASVKSRRGGWLWLALNTAAFLGLSYMVLALLLVRPRFGQF